MCILQQLLVSAVCSLFNGSPLCCMHQHVVGANQPPPARRHSRAQQPWKGEHRVRTEPNGNCHQSNHPGTCSQFLNLKFLLKFGWRVILTVPNLNKTRTVPTRGKVEVNYHLAFLIAKALEWCGQCLLRLLNSRCAFSDCSMVFFAVICENGLIISSSSSVPIELNAATANYV